MIIIQTIHKFELTNCLQNMLIEILNEQRLSKIITIYIIRISVESGFSKVPTETNSV